MIGEPTEDNQLIDAATVLNRLGKRSPARGLPGEFYRDPGIYDLDGRLFAARQMGPHFDKSQFALRRIHCEIVAGFIFVCVAPDPPDFEATRRQIEPYLLPHRLSEARVAFESTIVENGNWKL